MKIVHMNPNAPGGEDHIYLLNRISLDDYLSFMTSYAVDAPSLDRGKLAKEWRAADELMKRLRKVEAKWTERPVVQPIPDALRPLVEEVQADPTFIKAFSDAPVEFGIVELDRLVVSQKLVCSDHLTRLRSRLAPQPNLEQLFRFCLPCNAGPGDFRAGRVTDEMFAFISPSNDLRFMDAVMLRPEQISGYQAFGPIAGVIALFVGFGSNFLNAVAAGNRLVLSNGHHRACALRAHGVTHAPMIIQTAQTTDDLDILAPGAVKRNPEFYLSEPRPPVLKDYFDNRLTRIVRLAMTTREVRVRYSIEELDMP